MGQLKTHSARSACLAINPEVEIETIDYALDTDDLGEVVARSSVVVEGSDNLSTRFAVNAACVRHSKPLVSGAAIRAEGQVSVFRADRDDSPCYRCLFADSADGETCEMVGVLGPVVGIIGTVQALETIKILTGTGSDLSGRLLMLDGWSMEWNSINLRRDPDCPVCAARER